MGANLGMIRNETLSVIIILSAFVLASTLAGGLMLIGYFAIGQTQISIERARDIMLVIVPVITLVIGSAFGFIAGRKSSTEVAITDTRIATTGEGSK